MPTAAPSQKNLLLGAGELFFNRFDDDGLPTGLIHLGNVDVFEITTADDKIQKRSSMSAERPIYAERTRSRVVTCRIQIDEHTAENVSLHMMGDVVDYTQVATPVVDEVLVAAASAGVSLGAKVGGFYKTAQAMIDTVTLKKAPATALTPDVDYVVWNNRIGVIYIPEGSTVVAGDGLLVSYTPEAIAAGEARRIRGGTKNKIEGSLLFLPDPSEGPAEMVEVWNTSVAPDGALSLISEDFSNFVLNLTVQDDRTGVHGGSVDEPLYRVTELPAA